jgi:hypothetical protein
MASQRGDFLTKIMQPPIFVAFRIPKRNPRPDRGPSVVRSPMRQPISIPETSDLVLRIVEKLFRAENRNMSVTELNVRFATVSFLVDLDGTGHGYIVEPVHQKFPAHDGVGVRDHRCVRHAGHLRRIQHIGIPNHIIARVRGANLRVHGPKPRSIGNKRLN